MALNTLRRKKTAIAVIVLFVFLLIASMPAYIAWIVLIPHRYDPGDRSTRNDVTYYTAIAPPPEAQNIRVASFNEGQARVTFIRFSAPAEVCKRYAAAVMPSVPLVPLTENQQYFDTSTIYMNATRLHDLRWFDLPYASAFWSVPTGSPVFAKPDFQFLNKAPQVLGAEGQYLFAGYDYSAVRVDTVRGVFYFLQSN